jgi:hypothetical protein
MGRSSKRKVIGAVNAAKKNKTECEADHDFVEVAESLDDGESSAHILSDDAYDVLVAAVSNVIHKSRGIYLKNSRTTKWRRKKDSAGSMKITSFFPTIPPAASTNYEEPQPRQDTDNDADDELEGADEEVWFEQEELDVAVKPEPGVNEIDENTPGWQLFDDPDALVKESSGDDLDGSTSDGASEREQHLHNLGSRITDLSAHLVKVKHTNRISCFQYLQYMSILRYLKLVREEGLRRIQASKIVANALLQWDAGIEWKAKTIRRWSAHWCRYGKLPQSRRGRHQKTKSYIEDEDVQQLCLDWIRLQRGEITSRFYFSFLFYFILFFLP